MATLIVVLLAVVVMHSQQSDSARAAGNLEILSDTKGVDFGPYLSEVLKTVRANSYNLIPEEARPPQLATGITGIEFAILPDGHVAGMKIVRQSGMVMLDRAAWGAITASNPFSPLPTQFKGPFLALRMRLYYNPAKLPSDEQPVKPPAQPQSEKPESH